MNSRVHPEYKTKCRVTNCPSYDGALVRRGDITVWLSPQAIAAWTPVSVGKRGGQLKYSDLAIETVLTLRLILHLPLRQAEGFLNSLLAMMGIDLTAPDHTTLSRRSRHLDVGLHRVRSNEPIHLIVDSTGLSIVGGANATPCSAPDRTVARITEVGRRQWKKESGYHRQGTVENAFFRSKSTLGDRLRARHPGSATS